MTQWQPIATAPRDGTEILGYWQYIDTNGRSKVEGMRVIEWDDEWQGWSDDQGETHTFGALANVGVFTHWTHLPEPPA